MFSASFVISLLALVTTASATDYDPATGIINGGKYDFGTKVVTGQFPLNLYNADDMTSGTGPSYASAAQTLKGYWETQMEQYGLAFIGTAGTCDVNEPHPASRNSDYCDNRQGRLRDALVSAGVPEQFILQAGNDIDSTDGNRRAMGWVLGFQDIYEHGSAKMMSDAMALQMRLAENNSHSWSMMFLAAADNVCGGQMVFHEIGAPEWYPNHCECEDSLDHSSGGIATIVGTWTAGGPPSSKGIAWDIKVDDAGKYGDCDLNDPSGKIYWDYKESVCRQPKNAAEEYLALYGLKNPNYSGEAWNRMKAVVVRWSNTVIRGTFNPTDPINDQVVIEFPGECEKLQDQAWLEEEAKRLARYQGFSATAAIVAAPGWAYPPAGNPYHLEMGGVGNGEFHIGARYGWLNYRTSDSSEAVVVSTRSRKGEREKVITEVAGVKTTKTTRSVKTEEVSVKSVNANAMSVGLEAILGAGYHPLSCTLPASFEVGGEALVSGGRAADVGWSGGVGYTWSLALWEGDWVYSHQSGFVDFTIDIHPGGSVGNTTFELGLRQAANMVTSDPTGSALDLQIEDNEMYTVLVPVTSAVIGVRW